MDSLFSPPEGRQGAQWRPVSPKLSTARRLVLVPGVLLVTIVAAVVLLVSGIAVWAGVAAVLGLVVLAWGWFVIGRMTRNLGYAESADELYIRRGMMWRSLTVVPYGRMQYVDVQAGPVEQVFGIASVHLHTAAPGTSARLPGLPREEAARLRDRLTELGETQAAGL
ncbi:MAG: PH domain-containing protein [Nocardioidaceae bacterium]